MLQHGHCSLMEMHQFISDLITSGNQLKDQPDVLNAAWGVAGGGAAALAFKGSTHDPLQRPPPVQEKRESGSGRHIQPGPTQRKGETRDGKGSN